MPEANFDILQAIRNIFADDEVQPPVVKYDKDLTDPDEIQKLIADGLMSPDDAIVYENRLNYDDSVRPDFAPEPSDTGPKAKSRQKLNTEDLSLTPLQEVKPEIEYGVDPTDPEEIQRQIEMGLIKEPSMEELIAESPMVYVDGGWINAVDWDKPQYYLPSAEEIAVNRKAGLHFKDGMWQGNYTPPASATQEQINAAIEDITQKQNTIMHQQDQMQNDVYEDEDGMRLGMQFVNEMIQNINDGLDEGLKDSVNLFKTVTGERGVISEMLANPDIQEFLKTGAAEAGEPDPDINPHILDDMPSFEIMDDFPEFADNKALHNDLNKVADRYHVMTKTINEAKDIMKNSDDQDLIHDLLITLTDRYDMSPKDYTDLGVAVPASFKGWYSERMLQKKRNRMINNVGSQWLNYPDGTPVPEGHVYDAVTHKTYPKESAPGAVMSDEAYKEFLGAVQTTRDYWAQKLRDDQSGSLLHPDGTFVQHGFYYDFKTDSIRKMTELPPRPGFEKEEKQTKKAVGTLSADEQMAMAQEERDRLGGEMANLVAADGRTKEEIEAQIEKDQALINLRIKGIHLGNTGWTARTEALAKVFDMHFGTNYDQFSELNRAIADGALTPRQIKWIRKKYSMISQGLPSSGTSSDPLAKGEKAAKDYSKAAAHTTDDHPLVKALSGAGGGEIAGLYADQGQDYPESYETLLRLEAEWEAIAKTRIDDMITDEDKEAMRAAFPPLRDVLTSLEQGANFFNPEFTQFAYFAGNAFGKHLSSNPGKTTSAQLKAKLWSALDIISGVESQDGITKEYTAAMKFVFGLKAGSEQAGHPLFLKRILEDMGLATESAHLFDVTTNYLLRIAGDFGDLDPNQATQGTKTLYDALTGSISTIAFASNAQRREMESRLGVNISNDIMNIRQNPILTVMDSDQLEDWLAGSMDQDAREDFAYSHYDDILQAFMPLLTFENPAQPTVAEMETGILKAFEATETTNTFLAQLGDTDLTDREKIIYITSGILSNQNSVDSLKGALYTAHIANSRANVQLGFTDVLGYWESYLARQNATMLPTRFRNGTLNAQFVSTSNNWRGGNWYIPEDEDQSITAYNAQVYAKLGEFGVHGEDQAKTQKRMRDITFRNLSKKKFGFDYDETKLNAAINMAMTEAIAVNNTPDAPPVDLVEFHMLVIKELMKDSENKVPADQQALVTYWGNIRDYEGKISTKDRLSVAGEIRRYDLNLGMRATDSTVRGIARAPYIQMNVSEKIIEHQPEGLAAMFYETVTDERVKQRIGIPWMTLNDLDYTGLSSATKVAIQGTGSLFEGPLPDDVTNGFALKNRISEEQNIPLHDLALEWQKEDGSWSSIEISNAPIRVRKKK
tara:strand:+ start:4557 stop:8618 length:4062 start_codon:yes stop_codon:yes gene_type:complete